MKPEDMNIQGKFIPMKINMNENELLERLYFYLEQLEHWKTQFPYVETYRRMLPGAGQGIPDFNPTGLNSVAQLKYAMFWLDHHIVDNSQFSEEAKANFVYSVFDNLDIEFAGSNDRRLVFLGGMQFFINPQRYWRDKDMVSPLSSSTKSFETFGWCGLDRHSFIIRPRQLDEDSTDPTEKMTQLKIGLFPLSENFSIVWRYSRVLNAARTTHGIYASAIFNEQRHAELNAIIDRIIAEELHIACFPELMICPEDKDYLMQELLKRYILTYSIQFFVLVAGSFHEGTAGGDHYRNTIPIVLFLHGKIFAFTYSKHEPFTCLWKTLLPMDHAGSMDFTFFPDLSEMLQQPEHVHLLDEYAQEDIERDRGITILETIGFGKFGFAVCKDVLPDQSKILKTYGSMVDHLFVISLNESSSADFRLVAGQLALKRKISTLYVNARRYDPHSNTPTFVQLADKARTYLEIKSGQDFLAVTLDRKGPRRRRF